VSKTPESLEDKWKQDEATFVLLPPEKKKDAWAKNPPQKR